jgi:hypothetical protein
MTLATEFRGSLPYIFAGLLPPALPAPAARRPDGGGFTWHVRKSLTPGSSTREDLSERLRTPLTSAPQPSIGSQAPQLNYISRSVAPQHRDTSTEQQHPTLPKFRSFARLRPSGRRRPALRDGNFLSVKTKNHYSL